jgi:DNA invertase Pin-like site-specific DNA recombinase
MNVLLTSDGAANVELMHLASTLWMEVAQKSSINLTGFDPSAPLLERLLWARGQDLEIGSALSRFSTKLQCSTTAQVREVITYAAQHGIYVAPEFVCVDEGVSGRKMRRDGLNRAKTILKEKLVGVLLVFKVSRLFRVAYKGFQFFQEEVVDEGLRAISTSQGIDTKDKKAWKHLAYLHGIMDEMLLESISDHVRSGLANLFAQGYVTGALTLGYRRKEVPGAPPTKNGRPRTIPEIDPDVAQLIVQHFEWIRSGMPLRVGWRRWVEAGGPVDSRSTVGHMTYHAYRRMLTNRRYTGVWAFGKKRSQWLTKKDYAVQIDQPDTEVIVRGIEELRIIPDELFLAVQAKLAKNIQGPRKPKKQRNTRLCDLVIDCFLCGECRKAYQQAGVNGRAMKCKMAELCPCRIVLARIEAVRAVCEKLAELIRNDVDLIKEVVGYAEQIDASGDETVRQEIMKVEAAIGVIGRKIDDLTDLAGQGTDEDRNDLKAKIRTAQGERAELQLRRTRMQQSLASRQAPITPARVEELLKDFVTLIEDGAAGKLGSDMVYRAANVFRQLVGGQIEVQVVPRPGRKRPYVRGSFTGQLLQTVKAELRDDRPGESPRSGQVEVWLRKIPKQDRLAERVHQMVDVEKLSYCQASQCLKAEGIEATEALVWQVRQRHYQMIGQTPPHVPYNNGHSRTLRS